MLREDNADARLTEIGRKLGVVGNARWEQFEQKREAIAKEEQRLRSTYVSAGFRERHSLIDLLRRPELTYSAVMAMAGTDESKRVDPSIAEQVEIRAKYQGYIERQVEEVARRKSSESLALPADMDYRDVRGLSAEVQQKLNLHRPETIGQASRISGITPAAISLLLVHLKRGFRPPQKKTA
jgi:tRNA uridine 5-carboxymethylaminomethyl modification enzyme